MRRNIHFFSIGMLLLLFMSGCNRYQVVPDHLAGQVNKELTYEQVKASAEAYQGQVVVWGGEVLNAVQEGDRTKIEVLQMSLNKDHVPEYSKASSRGRFFAVDSQHEIIDPAIFEKGSKVTVVGEIRGKSPESSTEASSNVPIISIRDMTLWSSHTRPSYPYHPYYGYGYYGYRPYTFWEGTRVPGASESHEAVSQK